MDKHHDQNHNDWDGSTEVIIKSDKLLQSVKDGNNSAVKYLLEQGENPNIVDEVLYLLGLCVKLVVVLNFVKLMSRSRSGEGQEGQGQSQVES